MGSSGPAMRAPLTQSLLQTIDTLDPAIRGDVLGAIGNASLDEARGALPIAWLPFTTHMEIVASLSRVVGGDGYVDIWRRTMVEAFDRPFLRSFIAMSQRMFDFNPRGFLGKSDAIYHHVTRGLGSMTFAAKGDFGGVVVLWGFPDGFAFNSYADGLRGCFLAALDIMNRTGTAETMEINERVGSARFRITWG